MQSQWVIKVYLVDDFSNDMDSVVVALGFGDKAGQRYAEHYAQDAAKECFAEYHDIPEGAIVILGSEEYLDAIPSLSHAMSYDSVATVHLS